jgi:hypothetical protein
MGTGEPYYPLHVYGCQPQHSRKVVTADDATTHSESQPNLYDGKGISRGVALTEVPTSGNKVRYFERGRETGCGGPKLGGIWRLDSDLMNLPGTNRKYCSVDFKIVCPM